MDVSSVSSSISSGFGERSAVAAYPAVRAQDQAALQARPAPQSQDPQGAQGSERVQRVAAVDQGKRVLARKQG